MSNLETSYELILKELQKTSGSDNLYYKPTKHVLPDIESISLITVAKF